MEPQELRQSLRNIMAGIQRAGELNDQHYGQGHYEYNPESGEVEFIDEGLDEFLAKIPF